MIRKNLRLPYLFLIITPFVLLSPILLTGRALFWGTPSLQFVPWWSWAWETLRTGHLPLWNPLLGMGAPLLANYQSALFYPPNWMYLVLGGLGGSGLIAWGQAMLIGLHLCWAALGMALLARRLGLNLLAQIICGLSFSLSGYLVTRAGFLSINATSAWLPWIILGVTELVFTINSARERKVGVAGENKTKSTNFGIPFHVFKKIMKKPVLILIPSIGMQLLAGHAQTSWYTLVLAVIWGGYLTFAERETQRSTRIQGKAHSHISVRTPYLSNVTFKDLLGYIHRLASMWGWLGFVILSGILLAAVQLLPTTEYLLVSQRAKAVDYEFAMTYSFWPWRFLTVLAPKLFGDPATGDYWGYGYYWEDAIYVGLLPLILAMIAVYNGIKKRHLQDHELSHAELNPTKLETFLLIVMLFSFLLALGKNTPIFPWLYKHVPTFSMFQAPTRWTIWAEFALALLAGMGANSLKRPTGKGLYWTRLGVAGAIAISFGAGLAAIFSENIIEAIKPSFLKATAMTGVWGVGAGILILTAPLAPLESSEESRLRKNWWFWAANIFVAADLLIAGWGQNPGVDRNFYRTVPGTISQVKPLLGDERLYIFPEGEDALKYSRFFRANTFAPPESFTGWDNLRDTFLPNLSLLDGIPTASNFDPLVPGRYQVWISALDQASLQVKSELLNLMSVKIVENVDNTHPFGIYFQIGDPYPRIRWLSCGLLASNGDQALDRILNGKMDFNSEVVLEADTPIEIPDCLDAGGASVQTTSASPNDLKVEIEAKYPGFLLIADVWYPGWKAWIDDTPIPIMRANYLFRAVSIPSGNHEVTLAYRPIWFYVGLAICIIAWLGLGYLWVNSSAEER